MTSDEDGKRRWSGKRSVSSDGRDVLPLARVRKKRLRSSSRRWIERQLADPYVREARRIGYRSRAAFKLAQIDARFGLIVRGARVADLGCAPGGWLQVALARGAYCVVGIDVQPVEPLSGAHLICGDIGDTDACAQISVLLEGKPDLVVSDLAAPVIGDRGTDHVRTQMLAEAAAGFAIASLRPGGAFCCKVFQGGADAALLKELKVCFSKVRHFKPPASRAASSETYLIAQGFRADA